MSISGKKTPFCPVYSALTVIRDRYMVKTASYAL